MSEEFLPSNSLMRVLFHVSVYICAPIKQVWCEHEAKARPSYVLHILVIYYYKE